MADVDVKNRKWTNPVIINNLLAVCYIWSSSGFISYLLIFYTKYMKGDFFVNYTVGGISDGLSIMYVAFLSKKLDLKGLIRYCAMMLIIMSVILSLVIN